MFDPYHAVRVLDRAPQKAHDYGVFPHRASMRRSTFLKRMAFVALASGFVDVARLLPQVVDSTPVLVGDGIHDDAPALQVMLDGGGTVVIPQGTYRLGATLEVPSHTHINAQNSTFKSPPSGPIFRIDADTYDIHYNRLELSGASGMRDISVRHTQDLALSG